MVTVSDEPGSGPSGERRGPAGGGKFVGEDACDEWLGRGIGRVENDEAAIAEEPFEPSTKTIGHSHARSVNAAKLLQKFPPEFRRRKETFQFVGGSGNRIVQAYGADGRRLIASSRRELNCARRQRLVEDRTAPDFVPVVIFRVDPEHRHGRDAVLAGDTLCEFQRCRGLEQSEHRPTKKPSLLARYNRHGTWVGKMARGFDSTRWRFAIVLLSGQNRRELLVLARVCLDARNRLRPGLSVGWVSRIERSERREIVDVVGGKSTDPRKAAHVDAVRRSRITGARVERSIS
jgi:hypothetical protein